MAYARRAVRLGWERTYLLAIGAAVGGLAGVLITAYLIHLTAPEVAS